MGIEDIQDILESKPSVLVIGKGQPGMMRSSRSLRRFLKKNDGERIQIPAKAIFNIENEREGNTEDV